MNKTKCLECNQTIKDDHEHSLFNERGHQGPACCECFSHLVGCDVDMIMSEYD